MMQPAPNSVPHISLPPERFYWAMLDGSILPRGTSLFPSAAAREARLGYLFESFLPVPIDGLHSTFLTLQDQRVLACGLERSTLQHHREQGALTLSPASIPHVLAAPPAIDPSRLNFLTGPFEPPAARHARIRLLTQAAAAMLIATAFLSLGLERRAAADQRTAAAATSAAEEIYRQVLPPLIGPSQPQPARFLGELRSLRQTRSRPGPAPAASDAGDSLAQLLALWPASTDARLESLVVTPSSITLIATVPSYDRAQGLTSSLGALAGWRPDQPQVAQAKESVRLTARLSRLPESGQERSP